MSKGKEDIGHDHSPEEKLPDPAPIVEPDPSINEPPKAVAKAPPAEIVEVHGILAGIVSVLGRLASRTSPAIDTSALKAKVDALLAVPDK